MSMLLVGTLHGGLTPHQELRDIVDAVNPDVVLVELTDAEVLILHGEQLFRDEMQYVYLYCSSKSIPINNFDIDNDLFRSGVGGSEPEFRMLVERAKAILATVDWKTINRPEFWKISAEFQAIENELYDRFLDKEKADSREEKMMENILHRRSEPGTTLVFVGQGHLEYLVHNIPEASLYFE